MGLSLTPCQLLKSIRGRLVHIINSDKDFTTFEIYKGVFGSYEKTPPKFVVRTGMFHSEDNTLMASYTYLLYLSQI